MFNTLTPQGTQNVIFDSNNGHNHTWIPCVADRTVRSAVPIVAVLSRRILMYGVMIPAANGEAAIDTNTIRTSAARAAIWFVVGIAVRVSVVK